MQSLFPKLSRCAGISLMLLALSSCDGLIYDDLDPCPDNGLRIPFHYDMNMKFADAFQHEVTEVELFVFTLDGNLVMRKKASGSELKTEDFGTYRMNLDDLTPGTYDMIAWAHGDNYEPTFEINDPWASRASEDLYCTLRTTWLADEEYSDTDLRRLYHARRRVTVSKHDQEVVDLPPMMLTKDTNVVRVLLQHLDGSNIDSSHFDFYITDNYTVLDHNNTPGNQTRLTYRAWDKKSATAGGIGPTRAQTSVSTVVAELSTSRLMARDADKSRLVVRDVKSDRVVIDIPLTDYLLMVKGNYNRQMADQEFLDRQDDYSLHFFLDENNDWYTAAGIYINSWHLVPQDTEL